MDTSIYNSPFSTRYTSREMQHIFSSDYKFKTWRKLWVSLAKAQKTLGLNITDEQIYEMSKNIENINYEDAADFEKKLRHDVMAHVHAYGMQCKNAFSIIHLGATSAYVVDNTDIITMREALFLIKAKVLKTISLLSDFAIKYKNMPTLGFTHFQPAQLTTVGKRASLWIHDLFLDVEEIDFIISSLKFLGSKGTTGTQASFLELFDRDIEKVIKLEKIIANDFGFSEVYPVSGQTYSRKIDSRVINVLSSVAQSCYKFSNDIRLLQHLKEIEEPFEKEQIGSSAMAYKRNPMRAERIASLCRFIINQTNNTAHTASMQWFERTLDDSANKRLCIPESFMALDGVLDIYINIANNLVVYPEMIHKHIMEELPFMATENIMMNGVKKGGNRQELHEAIRKHSILAARVVKEEGKNNDLIDRIANDSIFNLDKEEIINILKPENFIGLSSRQVSNFIEEIVKPLIDSNNFDIKEEELKV
ncbi:MAG: adenylosuccinate lyase [Defluviitaleaceae bacterium]|nr:adenylosuccinate lyase [Defluviitaleaceae bacterium]